MSAAARLGVGLAVALLPRDLRDRYREQWTSDLRDAAEAGIRPSEIAVGSLAFAATLARPLPWSGRAVTPLMVEGRSRLAFALSLSAALLALSQFARDPWYSNTAGNTAFEFLVFFVTELLTVFGVIAPITAVVLVTATRGVHSSVRTAVWILAGASLTALVAFAVDNLASSVDGIVLGPGVVVYLLGAIAIAAAVRLYWRWSRSNATPGSGSTARGLFGGAVVLATGGLAFAHAMTLWAGRAIPVWSWEPWRVGRGFPPVFEEIIPTTAMYEEWLGHNEGFEQLVSSIFVVWAAANVALAITVFLLVAKARIRPVLLAVGAVSVQLIGHGGITAFLHSAVSGGPDVSPQLLILLGRIGLVAVILVGVGGVHLVRSRTVAAEADTLAATPA